MSRRRQTLAVLAAIGMIARARRIGVRRLSLSALLVCLSCAAAATEDRPRVGLVLGGGGARGGAHIGVIQALEELQIPVDYVVGSSMGSIVGGLYSAGYAPDEMARIIAETDWSVVLSDDPPRDELWFRRRQDDRRFQVDLQLGWRGGPLLPPGLIVGLNVDQYLEGLLLPVAQTDDFDDLAIPFRCIGIDIANGTTFVFEGGSLAQAIRASISLPGIFSPVEFEGRVIVDGGFVDNVPVDVARDMGSDVLIVVDVATPIVDPSTRQSLVGVYDQVIRVMMDENRKVSLNTLGERDVGIRPELGDMNSMAFDRSAETIPAGREAALALRDRLADLSVDDDTWRAWVARHRHPQLRPMAVRNVIVDDQTRFSGRVIREFAALEPGTPLNAASLAYAREQLAGLGVFERIEVEIEPVPSVPGEADVVLRPVEKRWGPHYLRFGLGLSSDLQGSGEFDLGVQHSWTPMNGYGGEWRNEVQLGSRTRLFSEYYQPLDPALRWFVATSVEYQQDDLPLTVERIKVAEVDLRGVRVGAALGRNLGHWGEARVGYDYLWGEARPEIALPGLLPARLDLDGGRYSAQISVDTLDRISFPKRGLVGQLLWESAEALSDTSEDQTRVSGAIGSPFTLGSLTVFPSFEGGLTLDGESPLGGDFFLGGFKRLSGLEQRELSGNNYLLGVLDTFYRFSERTTRFSLATFAGVTLELGGVWQDRNDISGRELVTSGSIYVGADTFVGPAYVAFGLAEGGEKSVYVFIGPSF